MPNFKKSRKLRTPHRRRISKLRRNTKVEEVITDPELLAQKLRKEKLLTALSVISLILAVLIALTASFFGLRKIGILSLPAPIEKLLGVSDDVKETEIPDDSALIGLITDEMRSEFDGAAALELSEDEYLSLLESTPETTEYSAMMLVTSISGDSRLTKRHHIVKSGDRYRVETYENSTGLLETLTICDGSKVKVTDYENYGDPISNIFPAGVGFTLENQVGIPSVTDFLGRDDIENLTIRMIRTSSENLYSVSYNYIGFSQVEQLYISLDKRLILMAESYALTQSGASTVVYTLNTVSVSENIEESGSLFSVD